MHVGDEVIARIADSDSRQPAAGSHRVAHLRRSLRTVLRRTRRSKRARAVSRAPVQRRSRRSSSPRGQADRAVDELRHAAVPNTKFPLSHALAAAEVACKAAKDRGRGRVELYQAEARSAASCAATKTSRSSATCAKRSPTIASAWKRSRSCSWRQQGPPRRFELLLRMIDPSGESVAPDKFLSAAERYQLATDIDRWVVQYALEILSSAAPALAEARRAFRHQHLRPVARRRRVSGLPRSEAARVRVAAGLAVVRDHRDRGGREHRARRNADPPPAGSGSRHRAR